MDLNRRLIDAAGEGNRKSIAALLEAGADISHSYAARHSLNRHNDDIDGPALYSASCKGHIGVITDLLKKGADINQMVNISTALTGAIIYDKLQSITYLLQAGADVKLADEYGRTALFAVFHQKDIPQNPSRAPSRGRTSEKVIAALVNAKADVNHTDTYGITALFMASEQGLLECIAALLKAGADVNHVSKKGRTALFYCGKRDNPMKGFRWLMIGQSERIHTAETTSTLLQAGADVNHADKEGRTALFAASKMGGVEVIATLVTAGADVNHADKQGRTALFEASDRKRVKAIAALATAGADVNHADNDGQTALFEASKKGGVEAIAALVTAGADVNHADKQGQTALSLYGQNDIKVKEILTRLGSTNDFQVPILKAKIERLESQLLACGQSLETCESEKASMRSELRGLEEELSAVSTNLTRARSDSRGRDSMIDGLKQANVDLSKTAGYLRVAIDGGLMTTTSMKSEIEQLKADIKRLSGAVPVANGDEEIKNEAKNDDWNLDTRPGEIKSDDWE